VLVSHLAANRLKLSVLTLYPTSDMDSPGPIDDEVIADSEGEMDDEEHPGNQGSFIQLFTFV
jgi:hypothetical protein